MDDDFFAYRPLILGMVFDLDRSQALGPLKAATIAVARALEADTEDKVYLYDPRRPAFDRLLGASIANIANWTRPEAHPAVALAHTLGLVARASPEDRRIVLYATDRPDPGLAGVVHGTCLRIASRRLALRFAVLGVGSVSPSLRERMEPYPFARYHGLGVADLTRDTLERIVADA